MKSQIELVKEKGIEVGSRVKVVNTPYDWMEVTFGLSFEVQKIGDKGVTNDELNHWFPVQSLEKVEAHSGIKIDAVMVVRKDNQEIITVSNNIHYVQSFYEDLTGVEIVPVYIVRKTDALIAELNKGEEV